MTGQFLTGVRVWYRWVLGKYLQRPRQLPRVIYPNDIFLVSYPRSGSAWLRRLIASMQDPVTDISAKNIDNYIPYVHSRKANDAERPRIIKSHEAYQPEYPRVIYLVRDGRDVAVSYHNFYQTTKGYTGSFDEFLSRFLIGNVQFGSWQDHILSWLSRQHAIPFMLLRYEQLHEDPYDILHQVAQFIHLDVDDAQIGVALQKHTFESRQKDARDYSPFYGTGFRGGVKGAPGAWKETFTADQLDLFWSQAGGVMGQLGYSQHED